MTSVRILTWNICGGTYHFGSDAKTGIREQLSSANSEISTLIRKEGIDIACLQEVHMIKGQYSQSEAIAKDLEFPYCFDFELDSSHLISDYKMGLSIISRYPLFDSHGVLFANPNAEKRQENGVVWKTHDKGVITSRVRLENGKVLNILCLHLLPFHKFGLSLEAPLVQKTWSQIDEVLSNLTSENTILFGDFNEDNIKRLLPTSIIDQNFVDLKFDSFTYGSAYFDHIVVSRKFDISNYGVITSTMASDHFPCYLECEI